MKISFYDFCMDSGKQQLLSQWHPSKNGDLTPKTIAKCSRKIIWWKCERGHEWQTQAVSRIRGTGCPVCYHRRQQEKRKLAYEMQGGMDS